MTRPDALTQAAEAARVPPDREALAKRWDRYPYLSWDDQEMLRKDVADFLRIPAPAEVEEMARRLEIIPDMSPDYVLAIAYRAAALLRRLTPATGAGAWREIATAPKDGREILIFHRDGSDEGFMVVVFYAESSSPYSPDHCWHEPDGIAYHRDFPTHWIPLPAPPSLPDTEGKP